MHHISSAALIASLLALSAASAKAQDVITYEVTPLVQEKSFRILMTIPQIRDLTVRLQIPVWSPGAYIVGNYAANIADISATDALGKTLRVFHPETNTWDVSANGAKTIRVTYTVKNSELEDVNGVPKRAHIRGPRTYLYVVGRKAEPVALSLVTPPGATVWKVATGLETAKVSNSGPQDAAASGKFRFTAPSYDVLADGPVEMGDFVEDDFMAGGKRHQVVLYGNYANVDRAKLTEYCRRIAEIETGFFGGPPYDHYVFFFRAMGGPGSGGGGLEHLSSTEIGLSGTIADPTRGLIAHEFFHLWNVKRIRPFVLGPFDYVNPPRTANLWWSEGVTDYYADLLSRRGDLINDNGYLRHLSDSISQLLENPGRLTVSADEASMRVWDGGGSVGFGGLSYYTKGELIGLCLDLEMRHRTGSRKSLDDVMKALYAQCKQGNGPGFAEDDIKATVNRISGQDMSEFYDIAARSTEELPLAQCLGYAGLRLVAGESRNVADLGMTLFPDREARGLRVVGVAPTGTAMSAGLKPEDLIVAVNGQTEQPQMGQLRRAQPGTKFTLTVLRRGEKSDIEYVVGSRAYTAWQVTADPAATPEQIRLRQAWLTGK